MNYDQLKQAFLEADRRAELGDEEARNDAAMFARALKSYDPVVKPQGPPSTIENLKALLPATGSMAAGIDFVGDMVPDAIAGVGGLAKGAYDALTTDKSFMDAGADAIRSIQENYTNNLKGMAGKITGTEQDKSYGLTQEAYAMPMEAGKLALKGMGALSTLPSEGLDAAVRSMEEPWRNPVYSTMVDVAGPMVGYGLAGKAAQIKPYKAPEIKAEPLPEALPPEQKSRLVDPEEVKREGMDVIEEGKLNPFDQSGDLLQGTDLARWQAEENVRARRWEENRLKDELEAERSKPLQYELGLEDTPLREEQRLNDNRRTENIREDFPTMDIELLPEKVAKDTVIKGMITRWNNTQAKLRELYQQANEFGLEGTRVRAGELGTTKKAKAQINALREQMGTLEKKLNNISQQLQNRMTNRHGVDVEGMPLFKGVVEKSRDPETGKVTYTGGKFSQEPPSVRGPAERTTGLTVEKTERGNMQRSPDANITGAEMVENRGRPLFEEPTTPSSGILKTETPPMTRSPEARVTNSKPIQKTTNYSKLGGVGKKQGGAVDTSVFTDGMKKLFNRGKSNTPSRPAPKSNTPVSRYMLEDTRNVEQFVKEEFPNAATWTDISNSYFQKVIQGKFVASMARNMNPLVQFITSKVVALDRAAGVAKENAKWGDSFGKGLRGFSKRIKSAKGALTFLTEGKVAEAKRVHEVLLDFDNADVLREQGLTRPTEQMLRDKGLNDAQVKAANAVYDQIKKLFDEVNSMLVKAGREPMKEIPGFIPHMWMGDYRVVLKDRKTGEVLDIRGAKNKKEAQAIVDEMNKNFPDRLKYKTPEIFDASRNRYKMNDVSAFQYALSMMEKGTAEHKIMNRVYKDIVANRGFKTHGLQRKGRKGFMGEERTDAGLKDFTKALEAYFDQGYNFIANQQKKKVYADVKKAMDAEKVELPNTREFIDEYTTHSTGGMKNEMEFIDNIFKGLGERAGFGSGSIKRGIQNLNGLASFAFLTTPKFLAVNTVQPLYNWAKLRNIQLDFNTNKNPTKVMMDAYLETFLGKASEATKQGLSWAKQNGFIDAKTIELMKVNASKVNLVNEFVYKGSKHTLGWWEQEVVRAPTFVMYDLMLRDVIKDNKQRWETAGALTDKYMIDYGKSESPFFYEKMGLLGESARPLKQYAHGYAGQMGEYVSLAIQDKQYSPLAGFLATQMAVSGAKGLPLFATYSALIMAMNNYFGTTFETTEDLLLGSGASSTFIWGPLSTVTGIDMSGSVSAPGIEDIWSMPGISAALNAGAAAAEFGGKAARGTLTDMDIMKTPGKIVPNQIVQALAEEAFTDEEGNVPDPNNRGLPRLTEPRTPGERAARVLSGGQLTREQVEKSVINSMKREDQRNSKTKKEIMDKMINDIIKDEEPAEALIEKYEAAGGDLNNLIPELEGYLRDSLFGQIERNILNSKGMNQVQKLEKLQEYKTLLEGTELEELIEIKKDTQ